VQEAITRAGAKAHLGWLSVAFFQNPEKRQISRKNNQKTQKQPELLQNSPPKPKKP
jgi:hypothetical protein